MDMRKLARYGLSAIGTFIVLAILALVFAVLERNGFDLGEMYRDHQVKEYLEQIEEKGRLPLPPTAPGGQPTT